MRSEARSAKAFIYRDDRFLLQHRDKDPSIFYPDHWGLFGGSLDGDETPTQGLLRELEEELNWPAQLGVYLYPWYPGDGSVVHIYLMKLNVPLESLELHEGIEMNLFSVEAMQKLKLAPEVEENIGNALDITKGNNFILLKDNVKSMKKEERR